MTPNSDWHPRPHMLVRPVVIVDPLLAVSAFSALANGESPSEIRASAYRVELTIGLVSTADALGGEALLLLFIIGLPAFQAGATF